MTDIRIRPQSQRSLLTAQNVGLGYTSQSCEPSLLGDSPVPRPSTLIDGYIAQMFDPQVAKEYHTSLLGRDMEPGDIQLQADDTGTGAFLATPPPGMTSGQHGWVVDYAVKNTGPVIRQKFWAPKKPSDKLRWVGHERLHPPIFFIHNNGRDLGLPLMEAASGNCMCLRGAEEAAPVSSAHVQIRINWRGYVYLDWNEQISIIKQTQPREAISLEAFAKNVARKTLKFMELAKNKDDDSDQRYHIGEKHITPDDIILIGTVQVSHGSWMPILQLNNGYYVQCLEI